jgi:hypothetical protein
MRRHIEDRRRIVAVLLPVALASLVTGTFCDRASAQAPERAAPAAALFDEAKVMMDRGNFAEACPKLAESESLDPQVGTMLNLALCYESTGKTASGCSMWRDAAAAAARKLQSDREELARERAEKVCSRAPRIALAVAPQSGLDRIEVTVDSAALPRERWGTPQPFDPGEHAVRATGPGLQPWESKIVVDDLHSAVVVVPVLAQVSNASSNSPPSAPGRRGANLKSGAWVAGAVGLLASGVGGAFGVAALVSDDAGNSARNCVRDICNASGESDRRRAINDAHVADVMFAVGVGGLATGVALWLLGSHAPRPASGVYWRPGIAGRTWSLSMGEAW